MLPFIVRRLLISLPILLASSLLVFFLVTLSGDPLREFRESSSPDAPQRMAQMRATLQLDRPFFSRYLDWVGGVIPLRVRARPIFLEWTSFDFGKTRGGQDVAALLKNAMLTSLRLVLLATVLAVLLGLVIGIVTAARQYSVIDYSATLAAFLCFSLPVFWLAVLLKEYGAIKFNDYLERPGLSGPALTLFPLSTALPAASLLGVPWTRRALAAGAGAAATAGLLLLADATDWLRNPGISLPVMVILAAGLGTVAALSFAPLTNRRVLAVGIGAAVAGLIGSVVFDGWVADPNWSRLLILLVMAVGLGALVGLAAGVVDRRDGIKAGIMATTLVGLLVGLDRFVSAWRPGRTIGTVGPQTPNLAGPYWSRMVDYFGHQILPSLALMLIGFATFMRFTRASMLETLNSDYVRTAKAKGLSAAQVILRHAFRTALIPVITVATISFATVIEGAVITETVFGWRGMGRMFIDGLDEVDPYPVMAFLLVVSVSIVLMNAIADVMYAVLDPRIRR
ncbi:hypothetical protein BH24ACT5_BH24ACT5_17970 [soil metagenome]